MTRLEKFLGKLYIDQSRRAMRYAFPLGYLRQEDKTILGVVQEINLEHPPGSDEPTAYVILTCGTCIVMRPERLKICK